MITPTEGLVGLARWLQELRYNDIRRAELLQHVHVISGKKRRQLRGVMVAPDLCLSRNRTFYKILSDRAVIMPLTLVAEQYPLKTIQDGYRRAKRDQERLRKQRAS